MVNGVFSAWDAAACELLRSQDKTNAKTMKRIIPTLLFLLTVGMAHAQTRFQITNVTVTENERVMPGNDATALMGGAEGSDRVVIFDQDGIQVRAWVKVSTHNVRRSSVKDGAVNAIFELDLMMNGKKDERRVEKIFYAGQERRTTITEKFTIKSGIDMRVITVSYEGRIE